MRFSLRWAGTAYALPEEREDEDVKAAAGGREKHRTQREHGDVAEDLYRGQKY